jgi:glucosamine 6-phosphate synthetase-like amidotransferase/phosphosugar isomerase protein
MCGIFGFISSSGKGPNLGLLKSIATQTENRGKDAFGIAYLRKSGRLGMYKQHGPLSSRISIFSVLSDSVAVIGHCRLATHGHEWDNSNNHPHRMSDGYFVHNGIVYNYDELERDYGLLMNTDCDSEVIGLLVEKLKGPIVKCLAVALEQSFGNHAVAAIFSHPKMVMLAKKDFQSLSVHRNSEGLYFASDSSALPKESTIFPNNMVVNYRIRNGGHQLSVQECKIAENPKEVAGLQSRYLNRYCGSLADWEDGEETSRWYGDYRRALAQGIKKEKQSLPLPPRTMPHSEELSNLP